MSKKNRENVDRNASYHEVIMPFNPEIMIGEQKRSILMQESWAELKLKIQNCSHQNEADIFEELSNCLTTYNPKFEDGNLNILEDLCTFIANENCEHFCLLQILLGIIELAEELESHFPQSIQLLCQNEQNFVQISKSQAASILANAFLCAFPNREGGGRDPAGRFASYPRINFNELYDDTLNSNVHSWRARARNSKLEKLKCLMNYFKRCIQRRLLSPRENENVIIFERKVLSPEDFLDWEQINQPLLMLEAFSEGVIEDAEGRLQVDFANEFVGGGTLGNGSAQEEIRFVTCPELIVSQLFTERLEDHEALVVNGFEQFSTHTGYGSSLQFSGDYEQDFNLVHQLVVLDALRFPRNSLRIQYVKENIDRELHKCLVGFRSKEDDTIPPTNVPCIASGKWGCGVFNGDPELKSIIQWMAASVANKGLELYTFRDGDLTHKMNSLAELASNHEITVGFMYNALAKFGRTLQTRDRNKRPSYRQRSLIDFLKFEIVPDNQFGRRSTPPSTGNSSSDENVVAEQRKVVKTRKMQAREPQRSNVQDNVSPTNSTSNLVPADEQDSGRWKCISDFCCRLQTVIPIIQFWVDKIPGGNLMMSFVHWIFFKPSFCLVRIAWNRVVWLLEPAFEKCLKLLNFYCKKTKMNNFRNPQAASSTRGDREKQELDLSDSE